MTQVFVGLGSNIEPARHLRLAISALQAMCGPLLLSPVYRSQPVGCDGDDFLNMVIAFNTVQDVLTVIGQLRGIEDSIQQRQVKDLCVSRLIDVDLLLYGDWVSDNNTIKLPRTDIIEYAFVLLPLSQIAPDLKHPVLGRSMAALWRDFSDDKQKLWEIPFKIDESVYNVLR